MNKKSLIKLQCVTMLALSVLSPALTAVQSVSAEETSSVASTTSEQVLKTNFKSKSDQTVLIRVSKTGDSALKVKKLTFVKIEAGKDGKLIESSSIFRTIAFDDGSEIASMDVKKDSSYRVEIEYDKSGLGSKEATLTTAILLKDGSTSSSAKRFNSKSDLDNLQDVAIDLLKAKSSEIETKLKIEKLKESSSRSDSKSDSESSQKSSDHQAKTKDSVSNKSDAKTEDSNKKLESSDKKDQNSDIKNGPAKVVAPADSKSSSKVDKSKLEEGLKISEQLLARQVDISKVPEKGKKDLEQSKKNLAERVERYKTLVKSEKADEKSINVAIEDLKAAAGHYSLLLDLKSSIDSQDQSLASNSQSDKDSNNRKDTDSQKSSASDQAKDQAKDQVKDQSKSQVKDQAKDQVKDQTKDQVKDQVKDQSKSQVKDQIKDQSNDQSNDQAYL